MDRDFRQMRKENNMFQQYLAEYGEGLVGAIHQIDPMQFGQAAGLLKQAYLEDKQVIVLGNGGSAGTANHFVCDFGKNAVKEPDMRRFRILSICDNVEKITALGNDIAFSEIFREQLVNLMNEGDVLLAISASGNSPDVLRACEYGRKHGAHVIALTGFDGGKLAGIAEVNMTAKLSSYEQVEDIHMIVTHMIVNFFKGNPEYLRQ